MLCPICNLKIKNTDHITLIKNIKHFNFIKEQIKLGYELYNKYENIDKVINNDLIFLKEKILLILLKEFKIEKYNELIEKFNINILKITGYGRILKHEKFIYNIYYNDIENINYVECKICKLRGIEITKHLNKIHKMNKKQYLLLYPNAKTNCENFSNKLRKNMLINNPNNNPISIDKMKETKKGTKNERSRKAKLQFLNGERPIPKNHGYGNGGWREDLGHYVRSNWEANFARLLNSKGISYEFEKIMPLYDQNGELLYNYLVDFYLPQFNSYIEIKGKWEELALEKVELFRKQYKEKYIIIEGPAYYKINKMFKKKIQNWE